MYEIILNWSVMDNTFSYNVHNDRAYRIKMYFGLIKYMFCCIVKMVKKLTLGKYVQVFLFYVFSKTEN